MPDSHTDALKKLSEAATEGEWAVYDKDGTLEIGHPENLGQRPCIVGWSGFDSCDKPMRERRANAKFIVALVNAYRAGLLSTTPASASSDDPPVIFSKGKWVWMGDYGAPASEHDSRELDAAAWDKLRRLLLPQPETPRGDTAKEVEVIDPWVMDLVRKHGHEMTNSEIVQKFLPKQRLAADGGSAKVASDAGGAAALYAKLYCELLYSVATKHPGETRHQTALRYIQNAERGSNQAQASSSQEQPDGKEGER